jgi:hypothetical protein
MANSESYRDIVDRIFGSLNPTNLAATIERRSPCGTYQSFVEPIGIATIISALRVGNYSPTQSENLAMTLSPAKTINLIGRGQHKSSRKGERGVTIVIVPVAMVSLLAMAVLAIDIVTLYVASGQAQQAGRCCSTGRGGGVQ